MTGMTPTWGSEAPTSKCRLALIQIATVGKARVDNQLLDSKRDRETGCQRQTSPFPTVDRDGQSERENDPAGGQRLRERRWFARKSDDDQQVDEDERPS